MGTISGGPGLTSPGGVTFVPGTTVPPNGAIVTDGTAANMTNADGIGALANVTIRVSSGAVQSVTLPANKAVLTDQQPSVNINQNDNTGSFAASVSVNNNAPTFTLANATTRIAVNGGPINVINSAGSTTVGGTMGIAGGAFVGVTTSSSVAIVPSGTALAVPVTGNYTTTATVTVSSGVVTAIALS